MVEKTYRRLIFSSIQKMADPVRISHELAEDPVLWIFSMGIEGAGSPDPEILR